MLLKSLEIQGFKSFADKTILEFGEGVTSVVGPNGSGKSNISDAVRWVLGEQSTKSLRGAKMEDVIFVGTGSRRAQGYAEVTLKLDNKDRALAKDADEVAVTRRYYRSGESEYKVNGELVRLKDINELFMDTGLGRDGYSMVSQGKVADLVSSKSNERREMLEEASGISHFRYRRADASRKLAQAEENLTRLRDIVSELEGRVEPLREQSEKAEKFLVLAQEKKELEIGLWLNIIEKSKEKLREQEHKISLATVQHENAQSELEKIETEIDAISENSKEITLKIDEIRRDAAHVEEQAAQLDGLAAVEKNSIEHNNEAIARINKDKENASDTQQHLDAQIEESLSCIDELTDEAEQKRNELKEIAENIELIQHENEEFSDKIEGFSKEISELSFKLADARVSSSSSFTGIEEIKARIESINEIMSTREETLSKLNGAKVLCEEELKTLTNREEELINAVSGYHMRVQTRTQKAETLKKELDTLTLEQNKKRSRERMLDELEKNMEGYSGSVKAVMKEAKRGTLSGIHGPLSQLISVNEKYAVAIETALGAAIQNIVTDNENDAKKAINFLKGSNAGRATFLPLTSVKGRELQENGLEDCFGFVNVATQLLDYDSKYSEIIKSQLGRTAVADDMDSAIAMAKKYGYRFKIVTLDGQVINAGGSMTGGSRTQNAGILSRGNEIERLRKEAEEIERKLAVTSAEYKSVSEEVSSAQADLSGAQADLTRTAEEKIRKESELELVNGQLEGANSAIAELEQEKATSETRTKVLEASKAESDKNVEEYTRKIDELETELEKITGNRESLTSRREELSKTATDINLKILACEKDVEALNDAIERLQRRRVSHTDRIGQLDGEIAEIEKKNDEHRKNIEELNARAKELRDKSTSSKESVEQLIAQRNETDLRSSQLRLLERNKNSEREQISGELVRLEERKTSMMKEYDDTVNKLYDEYQLTRREAEQIAVRTDEPTKTQRRLNELKSQIRALGSVNVGAIEEYKEVSERYKFMSEQINDIEKSRIELLKLINELTSKMAVQFKEQFVKINESFGQTFKDLFNGGSAELILTDMNDILECPIEIKVQPPGKNLQNIDLLSGGEKGLAAIALLFAILKITPAPFCIFDEVEAALDEVNVSKYAAYVRRMTVNTQFILITHRRGTMDEADMLYGVTMQEKGVSKVLELKTAEMAKEMGIA